MKSKKGFTLIELLAVIAILAVITTITAVIVEGALKKSNNNINKIDIENLTAVAKAYIMETPGVDPAITPSTPFTLCDAALREKGLLEDSEDRKIKIIISRNGTKLEYNVSSYTVADGCATTTVN